MEGTENDVHNFSTSSSHRLPTISASEALRDAARRQRGIPSNLNQLDLALQPLTSGGKEASGVQKGQVTEIYGPPGVGRTTFGIQLAVNTICGDEDHNRVVWIDTGSLMVRSRFEHIYKGCRQGSSDNNPSSSPSQNGKQFSCFDKLTHLHVSSLPHLLTMFINPPAEFPPPKTSLIIIDDLARFVLTNLPKTSARLHRADVTNTNISATLRDKLSRKALRRKFTIISELASGLSRTASRHGIAVVVLNHAATSVKDGQRAMLVSALSTIQGWTSVVHTRLMLYRDFLPRDMSGIVSDEVATRLRFVRIEQNGGKNVGSSPRVMFHISEEGIHEVINPASTSRHVQQEPTSGVLAAPTVAQSSMSTYPSSPPLPPQQLIAANTLSITSPTTIRTKQYHPPKRKADEIADSDDDDEERGQEIANNAAPAEAAILEEVEEDGDPVVSEDVIGGADVEPEEEDESGSEATPFQNLDSDAELTQDED